MNIPKIDNSAYKGKFDLKVNEFKNFYSDVIEFSDKNLADGITKDNIQSYLDYYYNNPNIRQGNCQKEYEESSYFDIDYQGLYNSIIDLDKDKAIASLMKGYNQKEMYRRSIAAQNEDTAKKTAVFNFAGMLLENFDEVDKLGQKDDTIIDAELTVLAAKDYKPEGINTDDFRNLLGDNVNYRSPEEIAKEQEERSRRAAAAEAMFF